MKIGMHQLFYQERGNLIRNYYCSECLCGPFLKEDIKKGLLIELGGERQVFYYCRKCYNTKHISVNIELMMLSKEESEREKYIISGQALEDLRSRLSKKEVRNNKIKVVPDIKEENTTDTTENKALIEKPKEVIKNVAEASIYEIKPKQIETPASEQLECNSISNLSAKYIVNLVKEKTGQEITLSLKSKKSIVKLASKILTEKGFSI